MADAFDLAAQALTETPRGDLEPWITDALVGHYTRADSEYDNRWLHYGSDLSPDACERKIVYRLTGAPSDPLSLGDLMRFHGGNEHEDGLAESLEAKGNAVERQIVIRPMRPSAWAWIGHADILLPKRRHLLEVKAPRAALFARAGTDPTRLVKDSYRWQASAYHHELVRLGRITRTSWVFLDREGSNRPVQVELAGDLLVPLDAIVEQERKRNELVLRAADDAPPPRPTGSLVVEVLKGRQKKPVQRPVRAQENRFWGCSYCQYQTTCQPGPETRDVTLTPERIAAETARAEALWLVNPKAKAKFTYGPDADAEPSEVEEDSDEQGTTEVAGHEEAAADPRAEEVTAPAAVAPAPAPTAGAVAGLSAGQFLVWGNESQPQENESEPADRDRNTGSRDEAVRSEGCGSHALGQGSSSPSPTPPAGSLTSAPEPDVAWDPVNQAARLVNEACEIEPGNALAPSDSLDVDAELARHGITRANFCAHGPDVLSCRTQFVEAFRGETLGPAFTGKWPGSNCYWCVTPKQPAPGAAVSPEGGGPGGSQGGCTAPLSADASAIQSPETPPHSPTPAPVCRKGTESWQRHKWHNGTPGCVRCGTPRVRKSPPGPSAPALAPQTPPPSIVPSPPIPTSSTAAASPPPAAAPMFPSGVDETRPQWMRKAFRKMQEEDMRELDERATGGGPGYVEDLAQRLEDERDDTFTALGVEDHRDEATDGGGW